MSELSHLRRLACETFSRELPKLYAERPEQWVAYHGDEIVGFGKRKYLLYEECNEKGFQDEDVVIFFIEPQPPEELYIGLGPYVEE